MFAAVSGVMTAATRLLIEAIRPRPCPADAFVVILPRNNEALTVLPWWAVWMFAAVLIYLAFSKRRSATPDRRTWFRLAWGGLVLATVAAAALTGLALAGSVCMTPSEITLRSDSIRSSQRYGWDEVRRITTCTAWPATTGRAGVPIT